MNSATLNLRPMSLGDILDRSVRLYRRHFLHTLGIAAVPYIIAIPVGAILGTVFGTTGRFTGDPRALLRPDLIAVMVLIVVGVIWLNFLSMGALALSVSERFLGRTPTIWGTYQAVVRRSLSLIWAYFLAFLAWGVVGVVGVLLIGVAAMAGRLLGIPAAIIVVVPVVLFVLFFFLFFRFLLITQVVMVEDVRGWGAMWRSWDLMQKNFWRAVLILLFAIVVAFVLSFVLQLPTSLLASLSPSTSAKILNTLMGQVSQVLTFPFAGIAFTLLYYDSRIRKEAFDLEMMAQNLRVSKSSPAASSPTATTPPPVSQASPSADLPSRPPSANQPPAP